MVTVSEDQEALFADAPELGALPNAGRAEAGLMLALTAGRDARIIGPTDGGLVAAALIAARALDSAEAIRDPKDRAYAVTALMPPFQRALHGLRLPAEVSAADIPPDPPGGGDPAGGGAAGADWLSDQLGPS